MFVPKLLLAPIKIRIFGPKTAKICIFGHFGPNIGIFCPFCPTPYQKPMRTRCLGGFSVMWAAKLLISPVKIRFFCPILARNWHFCSFWARPCRLIWCPIGGLVGGCGARAVSRKTPICFISIILILRSKSSSRLGVGLQR